MTTRILLVEDDFALRSSLRFVLQSDSFEVLEAQDGIEALELLDQERAAGRRVDLLISDIKMPRMDGVELLTELHGRGVKLPSIAISGHGDQDMLVDLLRLGCADFLPKPFEPSEVLGKVAEVLKKVGQQKNLQTKEVADLRDATRMLDREVQLARDSMESMEQDVKAAAQAYHELMSCCSLAGDLDVELRNRTFKELGGDYASICCSQGRCEMLVADVAGHDLAASYQTILIKSFFDENCRTGEDGETFFHRLNQTLRKNGNNERMVTALFVRLDLAAGTGQMISAGHPGLILCQANGGACRELTGDGDVLGLLGEVTYQPVGFEVVPGDRLFLFTDGLINVSQVDGASGRRRQLLSTGLAELIQRAASLPLAGQVDAVWKDVMQFSRGKLADDLLLFGLEIPRPE